MKSSTRKIVLSGLFISLGILLPFLTGQIPSIGNKLLPMHLPVLICGFVCGWPFGLLVGFVTPLLRSLLFSMPPMYPIALAMAFELSAYGLLTGILGRLLPKKNIYIYLTLIISMIGGRIIWGIMSLLLFGISTMPFTFNFFIGGALLNAIPGIILQIILVPMIIVALKRAGLVYNEI